jgi:hypothetical protein
MAHVPTSIIEVKVDQGVVSHSSQKSQSLHSVSMSVIVQYQTDMEIAQNHDHAPTQISSSRAV